MAGITPLEEQITCAVCFEICRNPHALRCLHTFCLECIQQLQKPDMQGVQCPECRDFSPYDCIKKDFKSQAFIDFYHHHTTPRTEPSAAAGQLNPGEGLHPTSQPAPPLLHCEICDDKTQPVTSKCLECDEFMCESCEGTHRRTKAFKNHSIGNVDAENHIHSRLKKAMNKLEREKEEISTKCQQISDTIKHVQKNKEKQSGDVDRFINELVVEVELYRDKIQCTIQSACEGYASNLTDAKDHYTNTLTEISAKIDFLGEMVKSENISTLAETLIHLDANTREIEIMKSQLPAVNTSVKSPIRIRKGAKLDLKSVIDVKFVSLDISDGMNTAPQSDPSTAPATSRRESKARTDNNQPPSTVPRSLPPVTANSHTAGSGAPSSSRRRSSSSSMSPVSSPGSQHTSAVCFSQLVVYDYVQERSINFDFYPRALTMINDELWCVADNMIHIFNKDCEEINVISLRQNKIQYARSITCCHRGNIVIACSDNQGLVHIDMSGQYLGRISEGSYSYVCSYNKKLYTLEYKIGKITVFGPVSTSRKQNSNTITKWTVVQEFKLNFGNTQSFDRLSVQSTGVYISSCLNNSLYVYNLDGSFQHQAGKVSGLKIPLMCGVDAAGNVLIADCDNHRIQVYDAEHQWHPLMLPGQLKYPTDAVVDVHGSNMWVITSPPNQLIKFTRMQ